MRSIATLISNFCDASFYAFFRTSTLEQFMYLHRGLWWNHYFNFCRGIYLWTGSKIIFTNGSQDPWRHASKQASSPESESKYCILRKSHFEHWTITTTKCKKKFSGSFFLTFSVPSYIVTCHNCGHGSDLRGCPQSPLVPEGRLFYDQCALYVNCKTCNNSIVSFQVMPRIAALQMRLIKWGSR